MKIGVPHETAQGEKRVALVPETVAKLVKRGLEVVIEPGAGVPATYADAEYEKAGAKTGDPWSADLVLKVQRETANGATKLKEGSTLVSFLYPLNNADTVRALAKRKASAIAVDMIPRTTL